VVVAVVAEAAKECLNRVRQMAVPFTPGVNELVVAAVELRTAVVLGVLIV